MPAHLEQWLHVADANGGLDASQLAAADSSQLVAALRSTAEREVQRLRETGATTPDGSYRISLEQLLLASAWVKLKRKDDLAAAERLVSSHALGTSITLSS